jgi:hypothetical protein
MGKILQYQPLAEPLRSAYSLGTNRTFFLVNSLAAGSNYLSMSDSAPATATTTTGWNPGTTAPLAWSLMSANVERLAGTFAGEIIPNSNPDNSLGDCFRSAETVSGNFEVGTWTLTIPLIAVTSGGDLDFRIWYRLWKGTSPTGVGATAFGGFLGATDLASDLTTADAQVLSSVVTDVPAASFVEEYLFLQIAGSVVGVGGAATRDVFIRVGSDAKMTTPDFTSQEYDIGTQVASFSGQVVRRRYVAVGY